MQLYPIEAQFSTQWTTLRVQHATVTNWMAVPVETATAANHNADPTQNPTSANQITVPAQCNQSECTSCLKCHHSAILPSQNAGPTQNGLATSGTMVPPSVSRQPIRPQFTPTLIQSVTLTSQVLLFRMKLQLMLIKFVGLTKNAAIG